MNTLIDYFFQVQQWLFEVLVQPVVYALGLGHLLEDAYVATLWFMLGGLEIAVLLLLIGPLQRWRPLEPVVDRQAIRVDVLYTLIHRLGIFRLALFFTLDPLFDEGFGLLHAAGIGTWHLDQIWPGVTDLAVPSFVIYLVVFDFVGYWIHRAQHRFEWWWSLHALHHAQRQMTMWSDNRNHLLDSVAVDVIMVGMAHCIGIAPAQFIGIEVLTRLSESLQHANVRLWFGVLGERLWVSPRFHRLHHAIGLGHESRGKGTLGGCNFAVLLPCWDVLFRSANFDSHYQPTGVRDQIEPGAYGSAVDYGRGFWQQQYLGLKRLVRLARSSSKVIEASTEDH